MKKKFLIISFLSLFLTLSLWSAGFAQSLVPEVTFPDESYQGEGSKLTLVYNLPKTDWQTMLSIVIQLILAVTGSLALASFTVGGVMMVTAQGNDEKIRKGKAILMWSVLALVIIATSYAIVLGVTQLLFFQ